MFKDVNGYTNGGFISDSGNELDPAWLSWGLFRESGDPCYYLLYKSLKSEPFDEEK